MALFSRIKGPFELRVASRLTRFSHQRNRGDSEQTGLETSQSIAFNSKARVTVAVDGTFQLQDIQTPLDEDTELIVNFSEYLSRDLQEN